MRPVVKLNDLTQRGLNVGRTLLRGPVPSGKARRDSLAMTQMGRRYEDGNEKKGLSPVGRVRAAQQRARSRGNPGTAKPKDSPKPDDFGSAKWTFPCAF